MKHYFSLFFVVALMLMSTTTTFAQKAGDVSSNTTQAVTNSVNSGGGSQGFDWNIVLEAATTIFGVLVILGIMAHMVYVRYFKKGFPTYDVSYFEEIRSLTSPEMLPQGKDDNALLDEIQNANSLFHVEDTYKDGTTFMCVEKKSEMKKAMATYKNIVAAAPTNQTVVDELNVLVNHINENNVRHHFHGSKTLLWIAGVVGLIFTIVMFCGGSGSFWSGFGTMMFFGVNIYLYILACQGPAWLMAKRLRKNSGHASTGIFAAVLAMIGGTKTVRTVTEWSDGTTTSEDDNSQHFIAWGIGLIVVVMMAFFLAAFALWNYLRNYVFLF